MVNSEGLYHIGGTQMRGASVGDLIPAGVFIFGIGVC